MQNEHKEYEHLYQIIIVSFPYRVLANLKFVRINLNTHLNK